MADAVAVELDRVATLERLDRKPERIEQRDRRDVADEDHVGAGPGDRHRAPDARSHEAELRQRDPAPRCEQQHRGHEDQVEADDRGCARGVDAHASLHRGGEEAREHGECDDDDGKGGDHVAHAPQLWERREPRFGTISDHVASVTGGLRCRTAACGEPRA